MTQERLEEELKFRNKSNSNNLALFTATQTAGHNPQKLAQILSIFDFVIGLIGWQNKPLADLSKFLVNYQASIDGKYHNDFKDVLVAEEIERKRAERKGISILSQ